MKPSVVLLGFILGSSAAICFGLFGVAFVFWLLGPENPELQSEVGPLLSHLARFVLLTAAAAFGFYGLLKQTSWRSFAIVVLVVVLAGVIFSYRLAAA